MPAANAASMNSPSISLNEVQQIVDKHHPERRAIVLALEEMQNHGYSHTLNSKTYVADLRIINAVPPVCCCFITISRPAVEEHVYHNNSLRLAAQLLSRIRIETDIPVQTSTLDTSLSMIPYHYLLSSLSPFSSSTIISLSQARKLGALTPKEDIMIDLLLGKFLGQLHTGVQNDWYGLPQPGSEEPSDPSYSWQETFTSLLEDLLSRAESIEQYKLPYQDIRLSLSRAIGSFLFDDVEVPSLVWFTGSEDDIYLGLPPSTGESSAVGGIAAILPNVAHALWGDPLMESFMMGSWDGPSAAFMEGYLGGGGSPLMVFPRQKTKRLWYTLFLSLVVLTKYGTQAPEGDEEAPFINEKRIWAKESLDRCIEALKDAPCY